MNPTSHTPNNIRILKGSAESLVNLKEGFHELTVLFQLKALYKSNSIHNYRSRWLEISRILGISESKLRKAVNYLLSVKLAHREGEDLRLAGQTTIKKYLDVPSFRKHTIPFTQNKNLETKIKGLVIHQNLNRQNFIIRKKTAESLGFNRGLKGRNKDLINRMITDKILSQRSEKGFTNAATSLSRLSIAKLLNRKSSSTGNRWMKKFKELNLIETDRRRFECLNIPYSSYASKELYSEYGGRLRLYNGLFYLIIANEIAMKW